MSALLESLAMKYGMEKAIQLLGIDKQQGNPKYAISMGGNTLDIGNMAKRGLLNRSINAITSGGMLGPGLLLGGALGLGYLTNPLREGSFNYNPNLQGQIDYASGRGYIGKNSNSGLMQYGPESVLRGQNVVSMFGTNDYEKQLNKYKDKYYDTMSDKRKDKLDKEIGNIQDYNVQKTIEKNQLRNLQNINAGGDGGGSAQTSGYSNTDGGPVSNRTGRGRTGYGKGGIASL